MFSGFSITKNIFMLFIVCLSLCSNISSAVIPDNVNVTLEMQNINLPDAIKAIAKLLDMNVVVSSSVRGHAMLNINNINSSQALNALLLSNGLAKSRVENVWLIAPQNEIVKLKQEELKWRELDEETAPLLTRVWQIKYAKASDVAGLLQDEHASFLSKRGKVKVDSRTNRICIQDLASRMENVRRLINHVDVPVQQISIAARLVSVDCDFERELGIHFSVKQDQAESNEKITGKSFVQDNGRYSVAVAKLADGSLLDMKLIALENAGHAELISNPSLFTSNQQSASIEAGEEVPYQEVSESGGTAIAFKKAVLGLKVTPQILPGKKVLLQLQINQDRPGNKMIQGMPAISTRQIVTNVLVKSGQTIVLGGIYETNTESSYSGLPFLSRIPYFGLLFKQQNRRDKKRELLIFVTPKIIDAS